MTLSVNTFGEFVLSVLCHSSSLSSPSQTHAALWLFM